MSEAPSITVQFVWKREDADGSQCLHCGDVAFLNQFRLVLISESFPEHLTESTICAPCAGENFQD